MFRSGRILSCISTRMLRCPALRLQPWSLLDNQRQSGVVSTSSPVSRLSLRTTADVLSVARRWCGLLRRRRQQIDSACGGHENGHVRGTVASASNRPLAWEQQTLFHRRILGSVLHPRFTIMILRLAKVAFPDVVTNARDEPTDLAAKGPRQQGNTDEAVMLVVELLAHVVAVDGTRSSLCSSTSDRIFTPPAAATTIRTASKRQRRKRIWRRQLTAPLLSFAMPRSLDRSRRVVDARAILAARVHRYVRERSLASDRCLSLTSSLYVTVTFAQAGIVLPTACAVSLVQKVLSCPIASDIAANGVWLVAAFAVWLSGRVDVISLLPSTTTRRGSLSALVEVLKLAFDLSASDAASSKIRAQEAALTVAALHRVSQAMQSDRATSIELSRLVLRFADLTVIPDSALIVTGAPGGNRHVQREDRQNLERRYRDARRLTLRLNFEPLRSATLHEFCVAVMASIIHTPPHATPPSAYGKRSLLSHAALSVALEELSSRMPQLRSDEVSKLLRAGATLEVAQRDGGRQIAGLTHFLRHSCARRLLDWGNTVLSSCDAIAAGPPMNDSDRTRAAAERLAAVCCDVAVACAAWSDAATIDAHSKALIESLSGMIMRLFFHRGVGALDWASREQLRSLHASWTAMGKLPTQMALQLEQRMVADR